MPACPCVPTFSDPIDHSLPVLSITWATNYTCGSGRFTRMAGLIGNLDPWVQAVFLKFKVSD